MLCFVFTDRGCDSASRFLNALVVPSSFQGTGVRKGSVTIEKIMSQKSETAGADPKGLLPSTALTLERTEPTGIGALGKGINERRDFLPVVGGRRRHAALIKRCLMCV
jgi:hypothetical protein